eukprot:3170379-Rhodomonas_salina.2
MLLHLRYAMSGTDIGNAATRKATGPRVVQVSASTPHRKANDASVTQKNRQSVDVGSVRAMRDVLESCEFNLLRDCPSACYAMSGTDLAYGATAIQGSTWTLSRCSPRSPVSAYAHAMP